MQTGDETPLLLTTEQAAHMLGLGRTQMFALIKAGDVESVKIGRSRRIPRVALDEFVTRLRAGGTFVKLKQALETLDIEFDLDEASHWEPYNCEEDR